MRWRPGHHTPSAKDSAVTQPPSNYSYEPGLYAPPAGPPRGSRPIWIWLVLALAIAVFVGGGWSIYDRMIRKDSGVSACQAMRDNAAQSKTASESPLKISEAQYKEWRDAFADSRYDEIRLHGTRLMDLVWQLSQPGASDGLNALTYMQPLTEHMSGLQSACADHGIILKMASGAAGPSASAAAPGSGALPACSAVFKPGKVIDEELAASGCLDKAGATQIVGSFNCSDGGRLFQVDATSGATAGYGFGGEKFRATADAADDPEYSNALQSCLG